MFDEAGRPLSSVHTEEPTARLLSEVHEVPADPFRQDTEHKDWIDVDQEEPEPEEPIVIDDDEEEPEEVAESPPTLQASPHSPTPPPHKRGRLRKKAVVNDLLGDELFGASSPKRKKRLRKRADIGDAE